MFGIRPLTEKGDWGGLYNQTDVFLLKKGDHDSDSDWGSGRGRTNCWLVYDMQARKASGRSKNGNGRFPTLSELIKKNFDLAKSHQR